MLKTRLEIVGDVKVVVVENSVVKSPFGKVQVGEARSSPVEKKEAGNHQVEIEARSQKGKDWKKTLKTALARKSSGMGSM